MLTMDPLLDHPGGIDAWLSTHCKIEPELLPLPGSDLNLQQLQAVDDVDFDLFELLGDEGMSGPNAQRAPANLQRGTWAARNGLFSPLSVPSLPPVTQPNPAVTQTQGAVQQLGQHNHPYFQAANVAPPVLGSAGTATQQPQMRLRELEVPQAQQLSPHSYNEPYVQTGPYDLQQQSIQDGFDAASQQALYQRASTGPHSSSAGPWHTAASNLTQQRTGMALVDQQQAAATSSNGFSTYDNAAELAAAVQAQITAAADQHTVAAQVSLTNAVNAAAAQLRSGGFSAATAQLQQQLQQQQQMQQQQLPAQQQRWPQQLPAQQHQQLQQQPAPHQQHMQQQLPQQHIAPAASGSSSLSAALGHAAAAAAPAPSHSNTTLPRQQQFTPLQIPAAVMPPSPAGTAAVATAGSQHYASSGSNAVSPLGTPAAPFHTSPAAESSTTSLPAAATANSSGLAPSAGVLGGPVAGTLPGAAAGNGPFGSAAGASGGLAGFQGVMYTPAGASTGVAVGSNLMAWVQGLQKVATQQHEAHERSRFKQKRKDKV